MSNRESHADLTSVQIARRTLAASREGAANQCADVGYRSIFKGSEQHMPNDPIDWCLPGEIQDVNKVIPAGVQEQ